MAKFGAIDVNGDKKIDFAEALAFVGGIGDGELNRLPRGFTELDEDGDGMISPMEFDQDISEEEFMKAELEDADEELAQEDLAKEELADTIGKLLKSTYLVQLSVSANFFYQFQLRASKRFRTSWTQWKMPLETKGSVCPSLGALGK